MLFALIVLALGQILYSTPLMMRMQIEPKEVLSAYDEAPQGSTLFERHLLYVLPSHSHYYPRFYRHEKCQGEISGDQKIGQVNISEVWITYSTFALSVPSQLDHHICGGFFPGDYRALLEIPDPIFLNAIGGLPYLIRAALFDLSVEDFDNFRLVFRLFGEFSDIYPGSLGNIILCSYDEHKMHLKLLSESNQLGLPEFVVFSRIPLLFFRFGKEEESISPFSSPTAPPSPTCD